MKKSIQLLKLKITSGHDVLRDAAELCRLARNCVIENWLLRQRGLPESERQSAKPRPRMVKDKKTGERKLIANDSKTESTKMYDTACEAAPRLDVQICARIGRSIESYLNARVDWRRCVTEDQRRLKRRDAILGYQDRAPFFTALEIPVRGADCTVEFGPRTSLKVRLLRGEPAEDLEITTKNLPRKFTRQLAAMAQRDLRIEDSRILYKPRADAWFWYVTISKESEQRFDPLVGAHLWPVLPDGSESYCRDRPFRLALPGDSSWYLGDGRYYVSQLARFEQLIKQIGFRYRNGLAKGHGRNKVDAAVHKRRQQLANIVDEVRTKLVHDIVRQCERHQIGTLIYHEPTLPLRAKCWCEQKGAQWDWTHFAGDLANSCAKNGIALTVEKFSRKEVA